MISYRCNQKAYVTCLGTGHKSISSASELVLQNLKCPALFCRFPLAQPNRQTTFISFNKLWCLLPMSVHLFMCPNDLISEVLDVNTPFAHRQEPDESCVIFFLITSVSDCPVKTKRIGKDPCSITVRSGLFWKIQKDRRPVKNRPSTA